MTLTDSACAVIDLHAHILPGLDDGAKDAPDALEMCRIAAEDGISTVVATPHMSSESALCREDVLSAVASLQASVTGAGIRLRILPGADVPLEPDLPQRIRDGLAVTVGDAGRYLLVELSRDVVPPGIEDVLFNLHLMGLQPIVTHPERNRAVQVDPGILTPLILAGNVMQITAGSLTGQFGRNASACAALLVKRRMAHVVATDAHSPRHRTPRLSEARTVVEEMVGPDEAKAIFEARPNAIIRGEDFALPEPEERRCSRIGAWLGGLCVGIGS
jgi:protein-tyrosine phosphatase